jgi:enoyl-CoA hydratase/isomerase-like protein
MNLGPGSVNWSPDAGSVQHRVEIVDLDRARSGPDGDASPLGAVVGVTKDAAAVPPELLEAMTVTYTDRPSTDRRVVQVPDVGATVDVLTAAVEHAPSATAVLCQLLRLAQPLPIVDALRAESFAYSMLLAGPEFGRWLAARDRRPSVASTAAVVVERAGDLLHITLDEPARRNPFSAGMRDLLYEALDVAVADPDVSVLLDGAGPNFCSGGDLSEFGTASDVVAAHAVRTDRSVGRRLAELGERVTVHVHGVCVGAGFEVPCFAGTVLADPGTTFRLPEVGMGLIPGAGGTVSIARRTGRWWLAHVALTGAVVAAREALARGAVDALRPRR